MIKKLFSLVLLSLLMLTTVFAQDAAEPLLSIEASSNVRGAAWNSEATQIIAWTERGRVQVWDAETGAELLNLTTSVHNLQMGGARWNPDETLIAGWEAQGSVTVVYVWDAESGDLLYTLPPDAAYRVNGINWNAEGTQLMLFGGNFVTIWEPETGENLLTLEHAGVVGGALWNTDETLILSRTNEEDGQIYLWDADTGDNLLTLAHSTTGVTNARLFAEDELIYSIARDNTLKVWDVESGENLITLTHDDVIAAFSVRINQAGTQIMTASADGTVRVWDLVTGEELLRLEHGAPLSSTTWANEEAQIVTWTTDGTVRYWDAETGEEMTNVAPSDDAPPTTSLGFGPGNRTLITRNASPEDCADECSYQVRISDAETGDPLLVLDHPAVVGGIVRSRDNNLLLTWAGTGVYVWDVTGVLVPPEDG